MIDKLCGAQLGITAEIVRRVVKTYTPYALKHFYNNSVMKASNVVVTAVEVVFVSDSVHEEMIPKSVAESVTGTQSFVSVDRPPERVVQFVVQWNGAIQERREKAFF